MFGLVVVLIVAATSVWVVIDASNLGVRKGVLGGGFLDSSPVAWFFGCILLWIVFFPLYLYARPRYVELKGGSRPTPAFVGAPLAATPAPRAFCAHCGTPIAHGAYCTGCGHAT